MVSGGVVLLVVYWESAILVNYWLEWDLWQNSKGEHLVSYIFVTTNRWLYREDIDTRSIKEIGFIISGRALVDENVWEWGGEDDIEGDMGSVDGVD